MTTLERKLHDIQTTIKSISKSGYNSFSKYKYVTFEDILNALRPFLKEKELILTFSVDNISSEFTVIDDKYYTISTVLCHCTLTDVSSLEKITVSVPGMSADKQGDKSCFKSVTGAKKYALLNLFCLECDDDPENPDITVESKESTTKAPKTERTFGRTLSSKAKEAKETGETELVF